MIDLLRRWSGPALLEPAIGRVLDYAALLAEVDAAAATLSAAANGRALVFLAMEPTIAAVVLELACLAARLPACLVESRAEPLARLASVYAPGLVLLPEACAAPAGYAADKGVVVVEGYRAWRRVGGAEAPLHPDLALLLTTSGSTGNPKLVRLTAANLAANALSIGTYLGLSSAERAIQSLPLHYSYGLSVLHSHLVAGGSVVLTPHSFLQREFWATVDAQACTSFAGVPYTYETLHRLRHAPARHPALRTYTQAGGALRRDLALAFHDAISAAGGRLFLMYGQTEATARIAYVPPERLPEKAGSIGIAIPGGSLRLGASVDPDGLAELIYTGPNVMLGYANAPSDLVRGDDLHGELHTGDLGRVDADGYFTVVARTQRIGKLFGRRINLEDVEQEVEARFAMRVAALDGGDRIRLFAPAGEAALADGVALHVARYLGVPPAAVELRCIAELPLTAAGKKNYRALEALA